MEAKSSDKLDTELHVACVQGHLENVTKIISQSQSSDPSYNPPFPAIMYTAARYDRVNIVEYCLDSGGQVNLEVVKIILIARAKKTYTLLLDRKATDVNFCIPWFGDILGNVAIKNDFEWTKLCLHYGADPNANLVNGHMSLLAAVAEQASVEMAALLVENGARVRGSGAIVLAAQEGKLEMVGFLLEKGADIDEIGIEHPTNPRYREEMGSALHRAVQAEREEVVRFLLDKGANVHLLDVMGRTPFMLAQAKDDEKMSELLKEREIP